MADAERGRERAVHRERRLNRLTAVVVVQNVLVIACLLVTVYVLWRDQVPKENVHIWFNPISGTSGNATLQFKKPYSVNMMTLGTDNQNIHVSCTGQYILYVDVCYKSLSGREVSGELQLRVSDTRTLVSSFSLRTSGEDCRRLHSVAYLRAREKATVELFANEAFKIRTATVGLSYLLGSAASCY